MVDTKNVFCTFLCSPQPTLKLQRNTLFRLSLQIHASPASLWNVKKSLAPAVRNIAPTPTLMHPFNWHVMIDWASEVIQFDFCIGKSLYDSGIQFDFCIGISLYDSVIQFDFCIGKSLYDSVIRYENKFKLYDRVIEGNAYNGLDEELKIRRTRIGGA